MKSRCTKCQVSKPQSMKMPRFTTLRAFQAGKTLKTASKKSIRGFYLTTGPLWKRAH